jgi:molybdopterin/thiamine biosynthesis adenylyltransferase
MTDLHNRIAALAKSGRLPDGTPYRRISVEDTLRLSTAFGVPGRDVEIAALKTGVTPERYVRNMKTFSLDEQIILLRSRVSIVGLGGLGGAVTEILARAGIGTLKLIDGDIFEDSNLNRQFLSTPGLMATSKAAAAAERVREINSSIVVQKYDENLNDSNSLSLIENSHAAVDCLDNVPARFSLERAAKQIGSPLVSAAVAGISGHVTTIFPEDPGLELIYGESRQRPQKGVETSLGCLPQAAALLASVECSEVIKILLGRGELLRNRLFFVDLASNTMDLLELLPAS